MTPDTDMDGPWALPGAQPRHGAVWIGGALLLCEQFDREPCPHDPARRCSTCPGRQGNVTVNPAPHAEQTGFTGSPPGMLQDDSRDLSKWLAGKPGAKSLADEAAQTIEVTRMQDEGPRVVLLCPEPSESPWLPIETAPADKTILLWHPHYKSVTGHILAGDIWGTYVPGTPMLFQPHLNPAPTHWQPLPAAPQGESK